MTLREVFKIKFRKKIFIIWLIFFSLIILQSNYVKAGLQYNISYEEKQNEVFVNTKHSEIHIEKGYLNKKEIYEIAKKIEQGIVRVKDYLGEEFLAMDTSKYKIKFYIRDGNFISNAGGRTIKLSYVKEKNAPYIHEIVHILASYNGFKKWISEGLAVYLNDYLGGYPSPPNFGKDLDELSKEIIKKKELKEVLSFNNTYVNPNMVSQEKRMAFYILSGSLVKYIEEKYGKEKLLKMYNSININGVIDKSFDEIKKEWITYVENL